MNLVLGSSGSLALVPTLSRASSLMLSLVWTLVLCSATAQVTDVFSAQDFRAVRSAASHVKIRSHLILDGDDMEWNKARDLVLWVRNQDGHSFGWLAWSLGPLWAQDLFNLRLTCLFCMQLKFTTSDWSCVSVSVRAG